MRFWSITESGHNHENQDMILVQTHPCNENVLVCVLADGQGGQPGGKEAAQTAVDSVWNEVTLRPVLDLMDSTAWCEIIVSADDAVEANERAGFTTLIAGCIYSGKIFGASVGDSAALLIREHDYVSITQYQRKNPPVGSSAAMPMPFENEIEAGDKLLLMSDGVWRYVSEDVLTATARLEDGEALIAVLRNFQMQQNSGVLPDDFSVILMSETPRKTSRQRIEDAQH